MKRLTPLGMCIQFFLEFLFLFLFLIFLNMHVYRFFFDLNMYIYICMYLFVCLAIFKYKRFHILDKNIIPLSTNGRQPGML